MNEYHKKLEAESAGKAYQIPAEKRHDDFVSFVNDVWFPLQVRDGKHKPKTIAFYESMTKLLLPCFSGSTLQGIGSLDIQRCLTYLRTEHKNQHGKPLTPKTPHHLYNTLNLIFGFAEKQELLVKNPMKLVDSPKKEKKPVDALTEEQAKKFFSLLPDTPLDFHCILQLLIGNVKKCAVGKHPKSEKLDSTGQAACCACTHSRYFAGGSPSGLRV